VSRGGQIVASIIASGGSPTEDSFVLAFAVIAASLVLSILAALAIPRRPSHGTQAVPPAELVGAES
jgi:hypothetical protein